MAQRIQTNALILALATIMALWSAASAQSSGCTSVLISMSPCLNYISGNSSSPSSSCCSQLSSVVRSQPQCLCEVLNGGGSSLGGLNINQTQALVLPGACNVQTPPISRCNGGSTSNSPSESPDASTDSDTPSGTGSKTVPTTTEDGTSDGSSTKMSISMLFFALLAVAYASA